MFVHQRAVKKNGKSRCKKKKRIHIERIGWNGTAKALGNRSTFVHGNGLYATGESNRSAREWSGERHFTEPNSVSLLTPNGKRQLRPRLRFVRMRAHEWNAMFWLWSGRSPYSISLYTLLLNGHGQRYRHVSVVHSHHSDIYFLQWLSPPKIHFKWRKMSRAFLICTVDNVLGPNPIPPVQFEWKPGVVMPT